MNNTYCCVPQCTSIGSEVPKVSFHKFPEGKDEKSKRRRLEWIHVLKIGRKINKRTVVCGKHFQPSDFFTRKNGPLSRTNLKKNSVPSLNLPIAPSQNKEELDKKVKDSLVRQERKLKRDRYKEEKENIQPLNLSSAGPSHLNDSSNDIPGLFDDVPEGPIDLDMSCPALMNDESICDEYLNVSCPGYFAEHLEEQNEGNDISDEDLIALGITLKMDVGTQVKSGDLLTCRSFIKKMTDTGLISLTGLHSISLLETLVQMLGEEYGKLLRCHQMPLKDQIILTLMRLKTDLSFSALSVLFECSGMTCKNIFKDVIKHLAVHLKCAIQWLPKDNVVEQMPRCFKSFEDTRVVLDCTEVKITKPTCNKCAVMTYSQYKGDHTIKIMIGISPRGTITFISPVFGGRSSDKTIFEQSQIVEYLEPHQDAVMVDKGFHIDDICESAYIKVIRPPFLRQRSQLSRSDAIMTTKIARARVHVERMIQRIKIFNIFQGRLPFNMLPYANEIFIVCAGLANLGKPIFAEDKF